jgi:hypothetical protein
MEAEKGEVSQSDSSEGQGKINFAAIDKTKRRGFNPRLRKLWNEI